MNIVTQWMFALTGDWNLVQGLFNALSANCTQNELEAIASQLSNHPHQVGIGSSHVNERVVGPFFDASKTQGGFDTPLSSVIAQYTSYLRAFVPAEIIEAALAELVDKKSGKRVSSMTVNWTPSFPPNGPGGGFGGGGFGGGGFGGGGFGGGGFGGGGSSGSYISNLVK